MIPTDLNKKQPLDTNPKAIQEINLTGNLEQYFSLLKKENRMFLIFHKEL